jgi:hypothetical protein
MTDVSCKINRVSVTGGTIALGLTLRLRRYAAIFSRSLGASTRLVWLVGTCGGVVVGVGVVEGVGRGVG